MTSNNFDRADLINALHKEFHNDQDIIPNVTQAKYISSTGSLDCDLLNVDKIILMNLRDYIIEFQHNLENASKKDYSKAQSALYAKLAAKCVEYVLEEQSKK